jgi:hypothetical protein
MRFVYLALAVVAILVVTTVSVVLSVTLRPIEQPIQFNHQLHVEDLGAECTDCHAYARTGIRATIPNIGTCADCHYEPVTDAEEETRLIDFIESESPIPWRKVYRVADHVFFSHRRHTAVAELDCVICHGPVGETTEPVIRPFLSITMDRCMQCHEEMEVTNDCIACHR